MTEVNRDSEKQFLSPETKKEIKKFFNFAKEKLQSLTIQGEKIEDKFNNFFSLLENLQESDIGKFENVDNLLKDLQRLTTEIENIIILIEKDGDNLNVMDMAAIALARENKIPIKIFSIGEPGNIARILRSEGSYTKIEN